MEQETYLDRIKQLKSSRKITNDKLSEMTGIPLGTLSKLLAGINDSPKLSNIVAISRALDCSLDWLITGVPANTNNYTLEPSEMTLVESYRKLDTYGRALVRTVVDMESARAERQADEETIKLHEVARRSARRGAPRLRRPEEAEAPVPSAAALESAAAEMILSAEQTPEETGMSLTAADLIRGGGETAAPATPAAEAAPPAVPRSLLTRSTDLPAGLRRRSISLYDLPVSAGIGELLSDSTHVEDISIPDDPRTAEADYALRISGDSMEPKYRSGDILLVQNAETVEEGELGIFVLDGAGYFKKYGGDCLISLNPKYAPIPLRDFADAACFGRVIGKLKRK